MTLLNSLLKQEGFNSGKTLIFLLIIGILFFTVILCKGAVLCFN